VNVFFDTNILVYAFVADPKQLAARQLLAGGGKISVQVLNEFVNVLRRKQGRTWMEIESALAVVRVRFRAPIPLTTAIHDLASRLARDHAFP